MAIRLAPDFPALLRPRLPRRRLLPVEGIFARPLLAGATQLACLPAFLPSCLLPPALPRRPCKPAAAQHVQMDVEDRLPRLRVGVEDRPEPAVGVALVAGHRGGAA